eukprot:15042467-Alexandrium_andersonii.AAC.1
MRNGTVSRTSTAVRATRLPKRLLTLGLSDSPPSQSSRQGSRGGAMSRMSFGDRTGLLSFGHRHASLRRAGKQTESNSRLGTSEPRRVLVTLRALRRVRSA